MGWDSCGGGRGGLGGEMVVLVRGDHVVVVRVAGMPWNKSNQTYQGK